MKQLLLVTHGPEGTTATPYAPVDVPPEDEHLRQRRATVEEASAVLTAIDGVSVKAGWTRAPSLQAPGSGRAAHARVLVRGDEARVLLVAEAGERAIVQLLETPLAALRERAV